MEHLVQVSFKIGAYEDTLECDVVPMSVRHLLLGRPCDQDINTIVTPTAPASIHTGPITRARACQLNYQVLSFLGNDSNVHENMMLSKLDTFVCLQMKGLAWTRNMNLGASSSMEMMTCTRGTRAELQVMISGL